MNEKTNFNPFENLSRGMMGAAVPMLSSLIKSVVESIPDLLKNILDMLSSIDLGELILSIVDEAIPMLLEFLDPLLNLLGPAKDTALNLLSSLIEKIGPLMGVIGPLVESIKNIVISFLRMFVPSTE